MFAPKIMRFRFHSWERKALINFKLMHKMS